MASDIINLRIDTRGTLDAALRQFVLAPRGIERARAKALRKLGQWVVKQALKEASAATGIPQKVYRQVARYYDTRDSDGIRIWIGTDPIKVHHLGTVRWTRRMQGARAGRKSYPGTWSWGPGSKTGPAVMRRTGAGRLPIEPVAEEIHQAVQARMRAFEPELQQRFQFEMTRAIRDELFREGRSTAAA